VATATAETSVLPGGPKTPYMQMRMVAPHDTHVKTTSGLPAPNPLIRAPEAEDVLAELDTLTTAQLSAIEECHRMNVRRLRQGSIVGWR
jgi:hypothetical protein